MWCWSGRGRPLFEAGGGLEGRGGGRGRSFVRGKYSTVSCGVSTSQHVSITAETSLVSSPPAHHPGGAPCNPGGSAFEQSSSRQQKTRAARALQAHAERERQGRRSRADATKCWSERGRSSFEDRDQRESAAPGPSKRASTPILHCDDYLLAQAVASHVGKRMYFVPASYLAESGSSGVVCPLRRGRAVGRGVFDEDGS